MDGYPWLAGTMEAEKPGTGTCEEASWNEIPENKAEMGFQAQHPRQITLDIPFRL